MYKYDTLYVYFFLLLPNLKLFNLELCNNFIIALMHDVYV